MKLEFYVVDGHSYDLRPNSPTRDWMDQTPDKYAYRCLPLSIANAHGWSFHLEQDVRAFWDGGKGKSGLKIDKSQQMANVCASAFGDGILTFFIHGVFRTEPEWNLMAGGSPNTPCDFAYPLTGVIETDWSPYSFTMNWKISKPGEWVTFEKGMPFCSVFPVQREVLQTVDPVIKPMSSDFGLNIEHTTWAKERIAFNKDLDMPGTDAREEEWQKNYFKGKTLDNQQGTETHLTKLRLKSFRTENIY